MGLVKMSLGQSRSQYYVRRLSHWFKHVEFGIRGGEEYFIPG